MGAVAREFAIMDDHDKALLIVPIDELFKALDEIGYCVSPKEESWEQHG